jgi:hypothetical protein
MPSRSVNNSRLASDGTIRPLSTDETNARVSG